MGRQEKPLRQDCQDMDKLDSQCVSFLKRQLGLLYDISETEEELLRKYSPIAIAEACACFAGYKERSFLPYCMLHLCAYMYII